MFFRIELVNIFGSKDEKGGIRSAKDKTFDVLNGYKS